MARIIPQSSLSDPTTAEWGDRLYVSVGGSLFEYEMPSFYEKRFRDRSIRDIYAEPGLMVVSTYDGIFVNNRLDTTAPYYSNGAFCHIDGQYYLCQDQLFRFIPGSGFSRIENASNELSGNIRKLLPFRDRLVSLNTKSINVYDTLGGLEPIHKGREYTAITTYKDKLCFGTSGGELFAYTDEATLLADLGTRIHDLHVYEDTLFISTDLGIFRYMGEERKPPVLLESIPLCVGTLMDRNQTLWISTENGLFVKVSGVSHPLPVIPNAEFNREALAALDNVLYAGSIDGLYIIDVDEVHRLLIPKWRNEARITDFAHQRLLILILAGGMMLLSGYLIYRRRHRKITIPQKAKETRTITLADIEADILAHQLATVESMAEYYGTNTVQLNRMFKTFETTPGKFLKGVKLRQAESLLLQGASMEDVVAKVGYSAPYIRKHLG